MKIVFWVSFLLVLYSYAGYPAILLVAAKLFGRRVKKGAACADVSIVLAVKNEEHNIGRRIDNLLSQTYSGGSLEIVVVCDGSTDSTREIAERYAEGGGSAKNEVPVRVISYSPSKGKPHAINIGVKEATGEIILCADARQEFEEHAVSELVGNFNDPAVGCVSGELMFYENQDSRIHQEMGLYWNFEKRIRKWESSLHSLPGATGAIYAIRKSLFTEMPDELLLDDVYVPMHVICGGSRAVFDEKAIAYDVVSKDFEAEKRRKVRTLSGNWQLLRIMPIVLHPLRNPIFFQYLSHKVLGRLIVPFCFLAFILSSIFAAGWFYKTALILTIGLCLLPLVERSVPKVRLFTKVCSACRTVVSLNYFSLLGFWYFISGRKQVWQ